MIFVYISIISILILKKYLDHQSKTRFYNLPESEREEGKYNKQNDAYSFEYFNDLIKCLILCTYNAEKFNSIPYVDSPFRGLGDDLEYVFSKHHFESMFRNNLISETFKPKLLYFKDAVFKINDDEWGFESVDLNHDLRWKEINTIAEELLSEMQIKERSYNFELGQPQ